MRTELVYQGDTYLFKLVAQVLSYCVRDNKAVLVLDRTIFYPQGGGQPSDVGTITSISGDVEMSVKMVKQNQETGQVEHEGTVTGSRELAVGETVNLNVDGPTRLLHSRIHSGGHLLDHAIQSLNIPIKGTKGYHFPAGPYVEYVPFGDLDLTPAGLDSLKKNIEKKSLEIINEKRPITVTNSKPEDLPLSILETLPEKACQSDVVRLIEFEGSPIPGPCGGTHVSNTSEIGNFTVKKVSCKANIIRVVYTCC